MSTQNEKELSVWGFTKGLRTGLITFLLSLLIISNAYLFVRYSDSEKEKQKMQGELYEKMLKKVEDKLEQPVNDINAVVRKVDTAATKAIHASDKVDSISNQYHKKNK